MKKTALIDVTLAIVILLFTYTAASKFMDYHKFVFQMKLAPFPLMKAAAPILGWLMPIIESIIVIGLLVKRYQLRALYATVILLFLFEIYIAGMLLSGSHLPCTCGGIISKMSWKQHLIFNAVFIGLSIAAIIQYFKHKHEPSPRDLNSIKDLSRA